MNWLIQFTNQLFVHELDWSSSMIHSSYKLFVPYRKLLYDFTLLKMKVPKGSFYSDAINKNIFWFSIEPLSEWFLKEPFFLSVKNILKIESTISQYKEPFVQRKGSLDVKGSSWNQ